MRADLPLQSTRTVGNTVLKLFMISSTMLVCVYGVLKLFASALAVFQ